MDDSRLRSRSPVLSIQTRNATLVQATQDAITEGFDQSIERTVELEDKWQPETSSTPWPYDALPSTPTFTTPIEPPPPPNRSIYALQTQPGYRVIIVPYNPDWPLHFNTIQTHLHNLFVTSNPPVLYTTIEHIGSTSIPGLAAKPNIDVLVTLPNKLTLTQAIDALEWEFPETPPFIRYSRVPNGGGIQGRESFKLYVPDSSEYYYSTPERSVYLIEQSEENVAGKVQIRCYRSLRGTLRDPTNRDLLEEYARVKVELGEKVFEDSISYSREKDGVVRKILRRAGWVEEDIDEKERLSERVWETEELPY